MPKVAWLFRILLLTTFPDNYKLETLLSRQSSLLLFSGKPVDGSNFAAYAQPKYLTVERIEQLIYIFDSCTVYSRKLLKHLRDKDRGQKTDLPQIINLFYTHIKE